MQLGGDPRREYRDAIVYPPVPFIVFGLLRPRSSAQTNLGSMRFLVRSLLLTPGVA